MTIKQAQTILRAIHTKQAGIMFPVVAGAGIVAATHGAKSSAQKAKEYKSGFTPGIVQGSHHNE